MKINTSVKMKVCVPQTPNFIQVGKEYMPIKFFSEKELKAIAREWTKALLAKRLK